MIKRIHLFSFNSELVDFFEHTTPHIHSLDTYPMVITTHMIHKMIGENKNQTEFEKMEKDSEDLSSENIIKIKK